MTLAVGMIFVGYLQIVWGVKSIEDLASMGGWYVGLLSLGMFVPRAIDNLFAYFGLVGSLLVLTLNPFVLASFAAAVGLCMRRRWGRRTAIVLAAIGLVASFNAFFWNVVHCLYYPRGFDWALQIASQMTFAIAALLPVAWYAPVLLYLSLPGVATHFQKVEGDAADTRHAR
jgi:hypothetical protein